MRENKFVFWQKWLTNANIATIIVGLLVAFAGNSIVFEIHNNYTREVFFNSNEFDPNVLKLKNWLLELLVEP